MSEAVEKKRIELPSRRPVIVAVIVLTLLSGIVHGMLDGRWAGRDQKFEAGNRLRELPVFWGIGKCRVSPSWTKQRHRFCVPTEQSCGTTVISRRTSK